MAAENTPDSLERLVIMIPELSLARDVSTVMAIARRAVRTLTGADGASFVLREGDLCYYADEEAIAPLWQGQRFPMQTCISGWAMLHRQPAVIEDIFADPRVPAEAYEPTFVKSLVMVPIRTEYDWSAYSTSLYEKSMCGVSAETASLVPTPKPSIGASAARRAAMAYSSRPLRR